jgi:hypothetical protein
VAPSTFLHNHNQVLTIDADLTQAWAEYRGQFTWLGQYLRRCDHYPHSSQGRTKARAASTGRGCFWSAVCNCCVRAVAVRCSSTRFGTRPTVRPLRQWLQQHIDLAAVLDLSNHQGLWPTAPSRTTLGALWFRHQQPTGGDPYRAYAKPPEALTQAALGEVLQSLINPVE